MRLTFEHEGLVLELATQQSLAVVGKGKGTHLYIKVNGATMHLTDAEIAMLLSFLMKNVGPMQ